MAQQSKATRKKKKKAVREKKPFRKKNDVRNKQAVAAKKSSAASKEASPPTGGITPPEQKAAEDRTLGRFLDGLTSSGGRWRVRGCGIVGDPHLVPRFVRLRDALEAHGVPMEVCCISGMVNIDTYTVEAKFLDGGLAGSMGDMFGSRGLDIYGPRAVLFVSFILGLRVPRSFLVRNGLEGVGLAELEKELRENPPPPVDHGS